MSLISGAPFGDRASVAATGWDVDALVRRAAEIYLEMIFRDSLYHADPQPGNLMLPDGTHIAILDFGDVGRISSMRRRQLEDLVIAAGTHDLDGFIDVVVEITTPPPSVDMNRLRLQMDVWLNRYLLIGVGHLDMAAIINSGMELLHENGLVMPADLSLVFRVMLQLQGLGRDLGTEVRVTELLQPYMKKLLAERFDPRRLARHAGRTIRGWDHLAASLPGDIEEIVQQIRAGSTRRRFPSPRCRRRGRSSRRRPRSGRVGARVRAALLPSNRADRRVDLDAGAGRSRRRCAHLATTGPAATRAQDVGQSRPGGRGIATTLPQRLLRRRRAAGPLRSSCGIGRLAARRAGRGDRGVDRLSLAVGGQLLVSVIANPALGLVVLVAVGVSVPLTWIGATRPHWRGRAAALAALGVVGGVVALVASDEREPVGGCRGDDRSHERRGHVGVGVGDPIRGRPPVECGAERVCGTVCC